MHMRPRGIAKKPLTWLWQVRGLGEQRWSGERTKDEGSAEEGAKGGRSSGEMFLAIDGITL